MYSKGKLCKQLRFLLPGGVIVQKNNIIHESCGRDEHNHSKHTGLSNIFFLLNQGKILMKAFLKVSSRNILLYSKLSCFGFSNPLLLYTDFRTPWHFNCNIPWVISHGRLTPAEYPFCVLWASIHTTTRGWFTIVIMPVG